MGDNRPPTRPRTRLFIKALEAQQQNVPRQSRSMSRPLNPDQPSSSARPQAPRAMSVPRFRAPPPQATPKALHPPRGHSTASKPKVVPLPRASGLSKKREAVPSPPEPIKKPRIKPAPIERPPQEVSELICVGLKGSGSSDAVDNSALEAMIKKRLAHRAKSAEAPSEPPKRVAVKKPDVAEPQIVINPGPRGKKLPVTSAIPSTKITSKPDEQKPPALPETAPKPKDTPVFPTTPKKELSTPKPSPKVSFWGSHGSYIPRKGSNTSAHTSGSESDNASEEKRVEGPTAQPLKLDFDKMEVDDGPAEEPEKPIKPLQTPANMIPNAVVPSQNEVVFKPFAVNTDEATVDVNKPAQTPVLLGSAMKRVPKSPTLAIASEDLEVPSVPEATVTNPPLVIVESAVEPKADDFLSVETAAEDSEEPKSEHSQTIEPDFAEKSLVADVDGQNEFAEFSPIPIRTDDNTDDAAPMLIDDFEYAPDGHNYGFEDAGDADLLFPKTDSLLSEPLADPSSEPMDVDPMIVAPEFDPLGDYNFASYDDYGEANVDNAPSQQVNDTDVVQDVGPAIEDVADETDAYYENDNVGDPVEVEAEAPDAVNAAIDQDEVRYADDDFKDDSDEKVVYHAGNEANVQFEFGDVISEAEFHEYFDANVEPEQPDAIEVDNFDVVSNIVADAELVSGDGLAADPETPAEDTNVYDESVVLTGAVDVDAINADFEEFRDAEMVDTRIPETGETELKPMSSPERVQSDETAVGHDESSGFFDYSGVFDAEIAETHVERGTCGPVKQQSKDLDAGMTDGAVVDPSTDRFQMYNSGSEDVEASNVKAEVEVVADLEVPKTDGLDTDDATKILTADDTDNADVKASDSIESTEVTTMGATDAAGDTKVEISEDAVVDGATTDKIPDVADGASKNGVPEPADDDDKDSVVSSGSFKYPMESLPDIEETRKLRAEAVKMKATLDKCDEVFTKSNNFMRKSLDDFEAQLAQMAIDQAEQELSIARVGKYVEWAENKLTLIAERQNQRQKHVFDLTKTANLNLSKVTHHLFRDDPIRHLHVTLKTLIDSCGHLSELQGAAAHVVCSVWGSDVVKAIVGWRAGMFSTKSNDGFIPVPASLIYTMAEMMTVLCGMEDPQHARLVLRDFYNSVASGMQVYLDGVRYDPSSRPNFAGLIDNPHYYD